MDDEYDMLEKRSLLTRAPVGVAGRATGPHTWGLTLSALHAERELRGSCTPLLLLLSVLSLPG